MNGLQKTGAALLTAVLALAFAGGAAAGEFGRGGGIRRGGQGAAVRRLMREVREMQEQMQVKTGTAVQDFNGEAASKEMPTLNLKANAPDQAGVRAQNGAKVTVGQITVGKTGKTSSRDDSDFHGLNAGVVAFAGSRIAVNGGTVKTDAEGANACFAWGEGAEIKASNVEIATGKDSSRGLVATDGGAIEGDGLTIDAKGAHSPAVAIGGYGGAMKLRKVQAKAHGEDSPGIYSAGEVDAEDCAFESYKSEAVVVDGPNSVVLKNCALKGRAEGGARLYQSYAGEAGANGAELRLTGGSLEAKSGPLFFVTNVVAKIALDDVKLTFDSGTLVKAAVARWGTGGGHLELTAVNQTLKGNVTVDDVSDVTLKLGENAKLTGALNRQGSAGEVNLELGKDAVWEVTADSSVDQLTCPEKDLEALKSRIKSNGRVIRYRVKDDLLNGDKIPLDFGGMLVYAAAPAKKAPAVKGGDKSKSSERALARPRGNPMGVGAPGGNLPGGLRMR